MCVWNDEQTVCETTCLPAGSVCETTKYACVKRRPYALSIRPDLVPLRGFAVWTL